MTDCQYFNYIAWNESNPYLLLFMCDGVVAVAIFNAFQYDDNDLDQVSPFFLKLAKTDGFATPIDGP